MMLTLIPVTLAEANDFVLKVHRHHGKVVGHKFSLGAVNADMLCGVSIVGRPVSRMLDDGMTLEVTRLATDGTKNACSFLYAASWRATRALGYRKLITYILSEESGTSLKASDWRLVGQTSGGSWSRPSREREDKHPLQPKLRYEVTC